MHVEVGPVSSASVVTWCCYARDALAGFGGRRHPLHLADGVGSRFANLLAEWEGLAAKGARFKWVSEMSVEEIEYLVNALRAAAADVAAGTEDGSAPMLPDEAAEFYDALITGLLEALRAAGGASSQFAEWLYSEWPGEAGRRIK